MESNRLLYQMEARIKSIAVRQHSLKFSGKFISTNKHFLNNQIFVSGVHKDLNIHLNGNLRSFDINSINAHFEVHLSTNRKYLQLNVISKKTQFLYVKCCIQFNQTFGKEMRILIRRNKNAF